MRIVETQVRVIYADTDAMGQAYYGNTLKWFEAGRAEWFRSLGMSYRELETKGIYLPVVEAHCHYRKPIFYDDLITVATRFQFAGPARLRFDCSIRREGDTLTEGYTVHACVDRERRVLRPPEFLRELLEAATARPVKPHQS